MNPTNSESSATTPDTLDGRRWYTFLKRYEAGGYHGQRLGQAFVNAFDLSFPDDSERQRTLNIIYNETNNAAAISRILATFTMI